MYQTNSPILTINLQSYITELQQRSHKIIGSLRLEATLVGLQSNPLLNAGSTQNSDQVSQGLIHLGLENLQKLKCTQLLWTSVPTLNYPLSEFIFPCIQADQPLFQFEHYLCPATVDLSRFLVTSSSVLEGLETMPRSDKLLWRKPGH